MAYKTCSHCGSEWGVRKKQCDDCGHIFPTKQKEQIEEIDWRTLKAGAKIKSIQGYGPHSGIFTVSKIDNYGIHAYQNSAFCYINMVERQGPLGIIKAHKVVLIK